MCLVLAAHLSLHTTDIKCKDCRMKVGNAQHGILKTPISGGDPISHWTCFVTVRSKSSGDREKL